MGKSSNPTFAGDKEFEKIHLKEKFSYGLGDVACNVVFALTTSLLIYFYTNVVGISAAMIGTIMLISRFFDGISDVLIGHLVDRTHSKYGKSRAWILWMMIPYGIAAILLFTVPPATQIVKGIYVFITYNFCPTVVYTALNLPYATLATLMTRDTDQRAVVNLFRTGMSALGNMVITAVTFPLVTRLGDTQQAWIEVSILYAIVSIIMLFICFKNCHERVKEETKTKDGKKITNFIECVAWRAQAEFVCKYLSKGRLVIVEGELTSRSYEDKDGNRRKAVEITADSVHFCDSKKDGGQSSGSDFADPGYSEGSGDFTEIEDNGDLPF